LKNHLVGQLQPLEEIHHNASSYRGGKHFSGNDDRNNNNDECQKVKANDENSIQSHDTLNCIEYHLVDDTDEEGLCTKQSKEGEGIGWDDQNVITNIKVLKSPFEMLALK